MLGGVEGQARQAGISSSLLPLSTIPPDDVIVVSAAMHFVYILRCADASFYIGETDDLDSRVARHQEGRACSHTAKRRPVEASWSTWNNLRVIWRRVAGSGN